MTFCPQHIVRWVSLHVVPQEQKVRGALRRHGVSERDIDDLIQDAYCQLPASHLEVIRSYRSAGRLLHADREECVERLPSACTGGPS